MYSKDSIAYVLKIPRIKESEYTLSYIEPVTVNNTRIYLKSNYYLKGIAQYVSKSPCLRYKNLHVCVNSQLEPLSGCMEQLMNGESAHCPTERIYGNNTIKQVTDGNIVINDADTSLSSNCLTQPRPLRGSYLVQFTNCSIQINNEEYANTNIQIPVLPFIPTTGLKVNSTVIINRIPLEFLQKLHLEQREHIKHLKLTTENLHWNLHLFGWTSFGSISTILLLIIIPMVIWTVRKVIPQKTTLVVTEEIARNHDETAARYTQPGTFMIPQE